jgi:hypothetical protein
VSQTDHAPTRLPSAMWVGLVLLVAAVSLTALAMLIAYLVD